MKTINTYLRFNGNCEKAFIFYKTVFGGEFDHLGKFRDMPDNPEFPIAESEQDKIMHVSLPIGNSILMGSDTSGEWNSTYTQGNNFSISIDTVTEAEANRLFNELSKNGEIIMPMNTTFWGSYFGMLTDQFGIQWMISFDSE